MQKTIDGGNTWFQLSSSAFYSLRSICFISTRTGFALNINSTSDCQILKTVNGGMSWVAMYYSSVFLSSIVFTDASTGYVTGDDGNIIKTINGGDTWNLIQSVYGVYQNDISFSDINNGVSVGFESGCYSDIFRTS